MGFRGIFGSDRTHTAKSEMAAAGITPLSDTRSLELINEAAVQAHPDRITNGAAPGIRKAEAAALVWPKWAVYATYAWIWVSVLMLAFQQGMTTQLNARAYANFASAPQITTAYVVSGVVGGIVKLPIAKMLNLWGRAEGLACFLVVYETGLVVLASSSGPNAFAAGYTLYWIGYDALYFLMDVFVADTSGLRNRAWAWAFVSTPFIVTAFVAPVAGSLWVNPSRGPGGWRWGYGAFCLIELFTLLSLLLVFKFYHLKAKRKGLYTNPPSGRTVLQSVAHYFHQFDTVGCVVLMAAFLLVLLPFSLAQYGRAEYRSTEFITMVVLGILLLPGFAVWERFGSRVQFVRWELVMQPTILGACLLAAVLYFSFYAWETYFYNLLLVAYDLDNTMASYVAQIYTLGSCLCGVVFGFYVRQTKHFKNACLFFAAPLMMLGAGLMIRFRGSQDGSGAGVGYQVMCQVLIAVAGGQLVIGENMAAMAAADRDGVPLALALVGLASNVGGAVGYAVAAAIYQNLFPAVLQRGLASTSAAADWQLIYLGGYAVMKTYAVGTPERDAIDYAWAYSQKYLCITATAILVLAWPAVAMWKNYNVDKKQVKGTVM